MSATTDAQYLAVQQSLLDLHATEAEASRLPLGTHGQRMHVLRIGPQRRSVTSAAAEREPSPVLMIPGGPFGAASFEPLLGQIQSQHHLLALDRPGCGLSDPVVYRAATFRKQCSDFVSEAFAALDLQRATIVGASLGGYFALAFALDHPQRVQRLVLLGPPPGIDVAIPIPMRLLGTRWLNVLLWQTLARPTAASVRQLFEQLMVQRIEKIPPGYLDLVLLGMQRPQLRRSWLSTVEALSGVRGLRKSAALFHLLPQLKVPTRIIWGAADRITPPARGLPILQTIPDFAAEIIPDAGHMLWLDEPERCAEALSRLLRAPAFRGEPSLPLP